MSFPEIEAHWRDNYAKIVKRLSFRAGTPQAAEDIAQEAYCRAMKYWKSFDGSNLDRWINTIVKNALRDHMNVENGYAPLELDEETQEFIEGEEVFAKIMDEVYELIDTKTEAQKEILTMHFQQGYSPLDIAAVTNHSYANCLKTVYRFRLELTKRYKL